MSSSSSSDTTISTNDKTVTILQRSTHKNMSSLSDTTTTSTTTNDKTVTILQRSKHHIVALKPPSVVCHHSGWTGSRSKSKRGEEPEIPMLQRVRDGLHDIDTRDNENAPMRKVNLIHRLDRGASGCLLFTYADDDDNKLSDNDGNVSIKGDTAQLIDSLQSDNSIKTYVALVRGEGILRGEDMKQQGWFEVDRPIKDEDGDLKDATTLFNFVSGQPENGLDRPRMSLVLCRPKNGRWHQIRRHLNGLSHPILGDSTHGHSKTNKEWKEKRNLPGERICLHLGRLQMISTENIPNGIDVSAPLLDDMLDMLRVYAPDVLKQALPTLKEEGILVDNIHEDKYEIGKWTVPEVLLQSKAHYEDNDVTILEESTNIVVAGKPPVVACHQSSWTRGNLREKMPMLQRVRDKVGSKINLVHRLDRGASGCLLCVKTKSADDSTPCSITKALIESMQSEEATKTYVALCEGDGSWNGINYLHKGWFTFDNPVKDENGNLIEHSVTDLCFVASTTLPPIKNTSNDTNPDRENEGRKISIVLARPKSGRWHQIRQHLSSGTIGNSILGDSSHGRSRTNRVWKKKRHLMKERVCLHLARLQIPATEYTDYIDVTCPLAPDLVKMLKAMPKSFMDEAKTILEKEGIHII